MFKFITRQHFLVNLLVALGLLFLLVFIFLNLLDVITRHNAYVQVPSVVQKDLSAAVKSLESMGFSVEVQDSVWDAGLAPLTVVRQSPDAGQTVKAKRLIFLTVNKAQPPMVEMPNLVGFSFRNAEMFITQLGLKLGDTTRKPDIAKDAVLEQLYQGRPIPPGTRIFTGSSVSFVLGSGLGNNDFAVPDIYGLTFTEAKALLAGMGLNIGAILPDADVKDTAAAYVYRQNPNPSTLLPDGSKQNNRLREGQSMDVWLGKTVKPRVQQPELDSLMEED